MTYLETSVLNVFAVGDLIQVPSPLLEQSVYLPLINNAVRSGQMCAENLKGKKLPYEGGIRIIGTNLFDYYLASCGLTESDGFLYKDPIEIMSYDVPYATMNQEPVTIKLTYNKVN